MYALNIESAKKADSVGGIIKDIGRYSGVIEQAYAIRAKSGAQGVAIAFRSDSGERANFTLYTTGADGSQIMGYNMLMSLLAVAKVREIKPTTGNIKKWDAETRQEVSVSAQVFPELSNKKVQILFATEDYEANDGSVKTKAVPRYFLSAEGFSSTEVLEKKTEAKSGDAMLKTLRHKPLKNGPTASAPKATTPSSMADLDDDIPF
jgi:hypothetical protein